MGFNSGFKGLMQFWFDIFLPKVLNIATFSKDLCIICLYVMFIQLARHDRILIFVHIQFYTNLVTTD